jgi:hypothetical protein
MISCRLYGRFGNLLYISAATIGHAVKHNYSWSVPRQTISPNIWPPLPFSHLPEYNGGCYNIWREPGHNYHEIPAEDNLILDGYYQSYKYFEHCIDEVRNQFRVPEPTENDRNKIIIHIRRGDYLLYPDKHPVMPIWYYIEAVDNIISYAGNKQICIVGDDKDYMLELASKLGSIISKKYGSHAISWGIDDYLTDFYKLCSYKYVVISNSSFSLMAAILNRNPDKVVICPDKSQWFGSGNAHLDCSDIYPEGFIELKY